MQTEIAISLIFSKPVIMMGLEKILAHAGFTVVQSVDNPALLQPCPPGATRLIIIGADLAAGSECASMIQLQQMQPGARILIFGPNLPLDRIITLFAFGAYGYLSDDASCRSLLLRIAIAINGERVLPALVIEALANRTIPSPLAKMAQQPRGLTPRDRDILAELVDGHPTKLIARRLDLSEPTIKLALKRLFRKLEVRNRTQAALLAREECLI
ncbi:two-component system nitrate/nitrite response regulator NarL [Sphingomonas zeicaulis]|uniref:LuxR C-terminal-related transcriptional regulator n=1 Tax=Sphingomonas zeicaulis TaxID=1632740 RepID=UPI003D1FE982